MHRIDTPGSTIDGLFTEGNPQTGTPATVVGAQWLNDVQENIAEAIEGQGISLAKGEFAQLAQAMALSGKKYVDSETESIYRLAVENGVLVLAEEV